MSPEAVERPAGKAGRDQPPDEPTVLPSSALSSRGQTILDFVRNAVAHRGEFPELFRGIRPVFPLGTLAKPRGLGAQVGDVLHGQPPLWLCTIRA
jgi:hypothetical protein